MELLKPYSFAGGHTKLPIIGCDRRGCCQEGFGFSDVDRV